MDGGWWMGNNGVNGVVGLSGEWVPNRVAGSATV